MADQATSQNPTQYQKLAREMGDLQEVVDLAGQYRAALEQLAEAEEIIADGSDAELVELAAAERDQSRGKVAQLEETLKVLLIPKDPNDSRNAIVEIRAGTGGDEAGLFARRPVPHVPPLRRAQGFENRGAFLQSESSRRL